MGPMDNVITSGVVTTGSMSTLTFNPLAASHAGKYTCRATLDSAMDSAMVNVSVESEWFSNVILYAWHGCNLSHLQIQPSPLMLILM
jgi:hypothetical protein